MPTTVEPPRPPRPSRRRRIVRRRARAQRQRPRASRHPSRAQRTASLSQRCWALAQLPNRLLRDVCVASARLLAANGPGWLSCSTLGQYACEHLGVPARELARWAHVGELLRQAPQAEEGLLLGSLSYWVLVELTRLQDAALVRALLPAARGSTVRVVRALVDSALRRDADPPGRAGAGGTHLTDDPGPAGERRQSGAAETAATLPADDADPAGERRQPLDPLREDALVPWQHRTPLPAAVYERETLQLAQVLIGHDCPEHEQLAVVVAETSTDIDVTVSAPEGCRRLGIPLSAADLAEAIQACSVPRPPSLACARPAGESPAHTGQPTGSARVWHLADDHPTRRTAHLLDRFLKRQIPRLNRVDAELEDGVLRLLQEGAAGRLGYRRFDQFAQAVLGLPPRTTGDYLRRARRRLRHDPIALAVLEGRISRVQGDLLERLRRQAWVPFNGMQAWIEAAAGVTVRRLRDMAEWAVAQSQDEGCGWSQAGCAPPTDERLRTSALRLQAIAEDATPPDPATLRQAQRMPQVTVHWWLQAGTLVTLAQLTASLQDRIALERLREQGRSPHGPPTEGELAAVRPPLWWVLLVIFIQARVAWAPIALQNTHDSHAILLRELYRCAAPGCPRRRGLESHHLKYKGRGGHDAPDNRAALCGLHHRLGEHGGTLRVRGRALPDATALVWEMGLDPRGRPARVYRGDHVLVGDGRRQRPGTILQGDGRELRPETILQGDGREQRQEVALAAHDAR